jgi:hypothetical protein
MMKTTNRRASLLPDALPTDLEQALDNGERVLTERDQTFSILARTHTRIPELLAERMRAQSDLGEAEIEGRDVTGARKRLDAVNVELAGQLRARMASTQSLIAQGQALGDARALLNAEREQYAASVINDFHARYSAALSALQELQREGDAIAAALGTAVDMPMPSRDHSGTPVAVDASVQRIGEIMNRLDAACGFAEAMRNLQQREGRLERSTVAMPNVSPDTLFTVIRSFNCPISGQEFAPGSLIDSTLIAPGMLQRLYRSRYLRIDNASATAA